MPGQQEEIKLPEKVTILNGNVVDLERIREKFNKKGY